MAEVREREELRHHEVDERFHEIVEREGLREAPPIAKRRVRWMQWLGGFLVLVVAAGVAAFVATRGEDAETSTYVGDPYAEMEPIEQAVADFDATRPTVYTGSVYAEMDLIDQLVAEFEAANPDVYTGSAYAEMARIDQLVADFAARPSTYVGNPYAELELIHQLVERFDLTDRYISDAYVEMELIDQAVEAALVD